MLTSLSISNFALIEKLNIDFSNQFSIITGETGAGKSILLGALGLVLGKRADLTSLKNKEEKCIIEAHFKIDKYNLESFFEEQDIDFQEHTIIRREILPSGKSRAFINDSPVNLQQLQDLSLFLIDIHSQHQTQELSDEEYQFHIIDAIAKNKELLTEYELHLKEYKRLKVALNEMLFLRSNAIKEQDYNQYLLNELLAAKLIPGEQLELESTFETLNNVEFIKEILQKSIQIAQDDQIGILQSLKEIKSAFHKIASFSTNYNHHLERINSVLIEFDDLSKEWFTMDEMLINDPIQLDLTNQKLQAIYNLQKKHHVQSVDELLEIQNQLEQKSLAVEDLENNIKNYQDKIQDSENKLNYFAQKISENRSKAIPLLSEKIIGILEQLGMPNTRFNIKILPKEQFFSNGKDDISFLFSANKGTDFGLLKKVASGGELSRIMLAIKSILAHYSKLPTIIFDEIDTGVSGEVANKMGEIMKSMSSHMQVFSITHLPQIASKGNQHYKVFKSTQGANTVSELKLLSPEERIIEIAEMLSGKNISESALNHAKALLN